MQDPREYLPFLRALRSLPPFLQRHKIDDHLGRYSSALTNLSKAGDEHFDEALEYTKKHGLFEVALRAYEGDKEKFEVRTSLSEEARVFAHLSLFSWSCLPMRSTSSTARATSKRHFVRSMFFKVQLPRVLHLAARSVHPRWTAGEGDAGVPAGARLAGTVHARAHLGHSRRRRPQGARSRCCR